MKSNLVIFPHGQPDLLGLELALHKAHARAQRRRNRLRGLIARLSRLFRR